jgi:WD40 repeat protein
MTFPEEDLQSLRQLVDTLRVELTQERLRIRSCELARVAVSQIDVDPERALLLALEATKAAVTFESRDALQQAIMASRLRWAFGKPGDARIRQAYFAKDNQHIISAGQDGVLRWWDLESQREVDVLNCCNGPIEAFHLSPLRDRALVTARDPQSEKYQHMVVDLSERKAVAAIEVEALAKDEPTTWMAFFSQDGRRLVISSQYEAHWYLWDITRGVRHHRAAEGGRCHGLDHEGRRAVMTRTDCSVVILNLEDEGQTTLLQVPNETVQVTCTIDLNAGPLPFSADGTRVTLGTSNRVACVWDARDGHLIHILGGECPCHCSAASFTPSGRYVLVQQNDSVATEIYDAETGKRLCELPNSSAFHVPMRFLPFPPRPGMGELAVVGMGSGRLSWALPVNQVSEWNIQTGAIRSPFRVPAKPEFERAFTNDGMAVHWPSRAEQDDISLDSTWVLRLQDDVVRLFARVEAAQPNELAPEYGCGYTADRQVAWSIGGQTLVDSQTSEVLASLGNDNRYTFSPNGQHLVTTSHAQTDPVIHVWNARTGQLRFTISDYTKTITALQFQPGQTHLLVGSLDRTIRLWSLETGALVSRATVDAADGPSYEAASKSDGTKVAFATSGRIHVWHIDRGEIASAPTTLYVRDPRFSADGTWLLALDENVARIWETTTMQQIGEFPWHFASLVSGDLSPDKQFAATSGADDYVRLWEPRSGRELTHWKMPGAPRRLRFSEDGACLWYPGGERLIVDVEQLIALAKTRVFRELAPAECCLFLAERQT